MEVKKRNIFALKRIFVTSLKKRNKSVFYGTLGRYDEGRRRKSNFCLKSIDISNAFKNVLHDAIKNVISCAGVGSKFQDLISTLLDHAVTTISSNAGLSSPRKIKRGVRQGDPIIGILFNLAINPLIRTIDSLTEKLNVLALNADDILLIAERPEELEVYLYELSLACAKLGLDINPKKCFSMHLAPSPTECLPSSKLETSPSPFCLTLMRRNSWGRLLVSKLSRISPTSNPTRKAL